MHASAALQFFMKRYDQQHGLAPPALATGCTSGCKTTCPRAGHGVHHHQSSVGLWVQNNLRALGNEIATRRARELFSVWCGTANAERGPWYVGYYSGVLANG